MRLALKGILSVLNLAISMIESVQIWWDGRKPNTP